MKKKWLLILLFFALISSAYAGDVHYLDFKNNEVNILTMSERDIARFNFNVREYYTPYIKDGKENIEFEESEKEQVFMLRGVREKEARVKNNITNITSFVTVKLADVTTFIWGAETPQYATLVQRASLQLDFDMDRVTDIEIRVLDFDKETNNVTFEFLVADKSNANYRPIVYINKTKTIDIGNEPGGNMHIFDYAKNILNKAYVNWEITTGIIIVLLILLFNRRPIERFFRRTF